MIGEVYENTDAVGLSRLVASKQISVQELVEEAIRRIEDKNPRFNAVVFKTYEHARKRAAGSLPPGPLSGVPFVIKDLFTQYEDFPVANGSRFLDGYVGSQTSLFADRMKAAGLVALGKSNVPEMGAAPTTEPAFRGPTINPWSDRIVPGGSSGGSAVAVASAMVPIADASDGGGSIRIPASVNGLVGLKPSRGRVPYGPDIVDIWYGSAVFGCVSRSVRDTAAFLDAVGGSLPGDPYFLPDPETSYFAQADTPPGRLKIGFVACEPDGAPLSEEAAKAVAAAARLCETLGHNVGETRFCYDVDGMRKTMRRVTAVLNAGFFVSCATSLGRQVSEADVEPVTWALYQFGLGITGAQHADDIASLRLMGRNIVQDLHGWDVLITPTLPVPPRERGWFDMSLKDLAEFDARVGRNGIFTRPFNISGQPAVSLPLHVTPEALPVGVQFVGRIGEEATLIRLGSQLEKAQPWMGWLQKKPFKA
ncbi:amidase [Vineibacter terrae]|uniref:amidase n=1 Tax=Vineibacter terrae TaxID=2586908 RepID=UPI002E362D30|nr:amidase [Vineibacter terrae]HEX2888343.1 amidase [Vineibacter terrae]